MHYGSLENLLRVSQGNCNHNNDYTYFFVYLEKIYL